MSEKNSEMVMRLLDGLRNPGPSFSASMAVGSLDEILCEKSASPSADLWFNLDVQAVFSWLRLYFADPEKLWILHNAVHPLGELYEPEIDLDWDALQHSGPEKILGGTRTGKD